MADDSLRQETRRWDDVKLKNTVLRTKEDAQDYRYFPDPDLIAVEISDEWLHQIESEVPELPITRYERYLNEYGMTAMEARLLSDSSADQFFSEAEWTAFLNCSGVCPVIFLNTT